MVVKGFDIINIFFCHDSEEQRDMDSRTQNAEFLAYALYCLSFSFFFLHFVLLVLSVKGSSVLSVDLGRNKTASAGVGLEIVKLPYTRKHRENHLQVIQEV